MKRSTPMKRSGFIAHRAGLPVMRDGTAADPEKFGVVTVDAIKPLRRGTYAGSTSGTSIAKKPRLENPHLLLMARNQPRECLLRIPTAHVRSLSGMECCACHGNGTEWNKGMGVKAHDFFTVWGCARCHSWLDSSYSAGGSERDQAFRRALRWQIVAWALIANSPGDDPKDTAAARWALDHLIERGYALSHPTLYATPNEERFSAR